MGWLEGLLTGYQQRHYSIEADKRKEAEASALREGKALESLLNSRDPQVKKLAAAGILDLAKPRKKASGLAGWLGEMEASPHAANIQRYYDTLDDGGPEPDGGGEPPPLAPAAATGGAIETPPPTAGSAALPATSPVTPGSPRLTQPSFAPGAGSAEPPPRPLYQSPFLAGLAPGGEGTLRTPGAPGAVAGALPGASGRLLGPPPVPPGAAASAAAASGASSLMSGASVAATPAGSPLPGASTTPPPGPPGGAPAGGAAAGGIAAGPPPMPPEQQQSGMPQGGAGLPSLTAPAVRQSTSLTRVPPTRKPKTDLFPTAADIEAQRDEAEFTAKITNYRGMYEQMGYSPQEAHARAVALVEQEVRSRVSGASALKEGNPRQLPDGTWVQDLYHPTTGQLVNTIPHQGLGGTGSLQERELMAQELFGAEFQGLDGRAITRKLTPKQSAVLLDEIARRKGYTAATAALMKAQAMADAPMTVQARNSLTNFMINDWEKHQKPMRTMREQLGKMEAGLQAIQNGDATGGAQAILVTFQKILDPTSVVRESEYDRSIGALPIKQQIQGWWQKYVGTNAADPNAVPNWVTSGVSIPIEELTKMAATAKSFIAGLEAQEAEEKNRIGARADDHGIPREYIFSGNTRTPTVTGGGGGGVVQPPPEPPPNADDPSQFMSRVPVPGFTPATGGTPKRAPAVGTINTDSEIEYGPDGRPRVKRTP
jgi:hypothetical protein